MLKKLLIALALLTASANANFFEALKDAAEKVIEEQNRLNNTGDGNSPALSDQSSPPQFNSLAEEDAYKKQQETERQANENEKETNFKKSMIDRMNNLRVARSKYFEKYLVKDTDSKEMIETKFKNKTKLVQGMQNDRAYLESEGKKIELLLNQNSQYNLQYGEYREFGDAFPWNFKDSDERNYVYFYNDPDSSGSARDIVDENQYTAYLKEAYGNYDTRQAKLAVVKANQVKQAKAQKEQQAKLANEPQERQKVQKACQAWRTKANQKVYSLGIGDRVAGKGTGYYVIQGVNANTFLVNTFGGTGYLKKSDSVPYDSLKAAPSEYCYR